MRRDRYSRAKDLHADHGSDCERGGNRKGNHISLLPVQKGDLQAVLNHDMEFLKMSTLERIDAAGNLKDKIRAFALSRLENAEARKEIFRIMDTESGSLSFTRSQYRDWLREPVLRLASAIEEASRRGEICRVPSEKAAWIIADMTRGTIQRRLLGQSDTLPSEDSEFLLGFIWAALVAAGNQGTTPRFPNRGSLIYFGEDEYQILLYALLGLVFMGCGYCLRRTGFAEFAFRRRNSGCSR